MGMAGRDPVFSAQLESEMNTYPRDAADIQIANGAGAYLPELSHECHVPGHGRRVNFKVASIQDTSWPNAPAESLAPAREITAPARPEAGRHTLFGMNLVVLTMYDQFRALFGLLPDTNPPGGTTYSFRFALDHGAWQIDNETATCARSRSRAPTASSSRKCA